MSGQTFVGARLVAPDGIVWTVVRKWIGPGRFITVHVRSDAGATRYLPSAEVEAWPIAS